MAKGFLRSSADGEEPDPENEGAGLEKMYLKLFPKIGRDFVHHEDLIRVIVHLLDLLEVDPVAISHFLALAQKEAAIHRALEYKRFLDMGEDSNAIYQDLINLDDE